MSSDEAALRLERIAKAPGRATVADVAWLVAQVRKLMAEVAVLEQQVSRERYNVAAMTERPIR